MCLLHRAAPNTSSCQGRGDVGHALQAYQQSLLASPGAAEAGAAWGALQGTEAALRAQYPGLLPGEALLNSQVGLWVFALSGWVLW